MRLPAHLEVSSLIRLAEAHGGSAMVLAKGESDAGTILIVAVHRGQNALLFERMPQLDGTRPFIETKAQDPSKPEEFSLYLSRRHEQDPDIWILEVDIEEPERLIALIVN